VEASRVQLKLWQSPCQELDTLAICQQDFLGTQRRYDIPYEQQEERVDSLKTNRISRILPVVKQDELLRDFMVEPI
jgi:hypothetical protein